jgi:peptidylprolyl isomerase domain and WD repeat-containing protein 1
MSSTDEPVLGKRTRDGGADVTMAEGSSSAQNVVIAEAEDSDDDIGPMPLPADGSSTGIVKKKRKGKEIVALILQVN